MQYRAKRAGTVGPRGETRRVSVGDVFELPQGVKPGRWMEPLDYAETSGGKAPKRRASPRPAKAEDAEPTTFSELSERDADTIPPA